MRFGWAIVASVLFIGSGVALYSASKAGPSNEELDRDIGEVDGRLSAAKVAAAVYKVGSPIRLEADLDVLVLTTTRDMLAQKRSAWFKGISLSFVSEGLSLNPADAETIAKLSDDYDAAEQKAKSSKLEAERYNPGSLFALTAQLGYLSDHVTASMARQQLVAARLGLIKTRALPVGLKRDDKGAL